MVEQLQEGLLLRVEEGSKGLGLTQPVLLEEGDLVGLRVAGDLHWGVEVPEVSSAGIGHFSPVEQQPVGCTEVSAGRRSTRHHSHKGVQAPETRSELISVSGNWAAA